MEFINILAVLLSPVFALVVGKYLQTCEKNREDKLQIFKVLMMYRGIGWHIETVRALNLIEIVFSDDNDVLEQWKKYYNKLCNENPSTTDLLSIKNEGDRLLQVMAKSLGYGDNITWEIIQKPYIPLGMRKSIELQEQNQKNISEVLSEMSKVIPKT